MPPGAFIDSCFGGLMALAPAKAGIFWPHADSTNRSVLRLGIGLLNQLACWTAPATANDAGAEEGVELKLFVLCANATSAEKLDRFLDREPSIKYL